MGKSPYQISKELHVSSQAVYQKIKKLEKELKPFIVKDSKGKTKIKEQGEIILKNSFDNIQESMQSVVQEVEEIIQPSMQSVVQADIQSLVQVEFENKIKLLQKDIDVLNNTVSEKEKIIESKEKDIEYFKSELSKVNDIVKNQTYLLALTEALNNDTNIKAEEVDQEEVEKTEPSDTDNNIDDIIISELKSKKFIEKIKYLFLD